MKGKDQQKKLRQLHSAFSIKQIISSDIIIMLTDQYRFGQVIFFYETTNIICLSPSEEFEKVVLGFHKIFSKYRSKYFLIKRITKEQIKIQNNCLTYSLYTLSSRTIRSNNESEIKK